MRKLLLMQDDCAPDSMETFYKDMKERFGLLPSDFPRESCTEPDDMTLAYHFGNFTLEVSADDPYYKLYEEVEDEGEVGR